MLVAYTKRPGLFLRVASALLSAIFSVIFSAEQREAVPGKQEALTFNTR